MARYTQSRPSCLGAVSARDVKKGGTHRGVWCAFMTHSLCGSSSASPSSSSLRLGASSSSSMPWWLWLSGAVSGVPSCSAAMLASTGVRSRRGTGVPSFLLHSNTMAETQAQAARQCVSAVWWLRTPCEPIQLPVVLNRKVLTVQLPAQCACSSPHSHAPHLGLGRGVLLPNWLPGVVASRLNRCLLAGVPAVGLGTPDVKLRLTGTPALPLPASAEPSNTLPPAAAAPPTRCRVLAAAAAAALQADGGPLRPGTLVPAGGTLPGRVRLPGWAGPLLLVAAVLHRVVAFNLSAPWLPVSVGLGVSRSPLLCLGGESKCPSAAAAPSSCRPGMARKPLPTAVGAALHPSAAPSAAGKLLLCSACMPELRFRGASRGLGGSSCDPALLSTAPLLLLPVRGWDFTSRLGVSSSTGPADGQGVRSMSANGRETPALPCCSVWYPPAACRGMHGDAAAAAPGAAATAGLLLATGVIVDSASRGTTGLR